MLESSDRQHLFVGALQKKPETELHEGMQAALESIRLDARSPYAHFALAIVSVFAGELPQALRAAEAAVELGPSFALGHMVLGMGRLFSGDAAGAIQPLEHGLRMSPRDPQNFNWLQMLAFALFFSGLRDAALSAAHRALKVRPSWQPTLEKLVMCYAALGRMDNAHALLEKMEHLEQPARDMFAQFKAHNPAWAAEMSSILQGVARSGRSVTDSPDSPPAADRGGA